MSAAQQSGAGIGRVLVVGGSGRLGTLLRLAWARAGQAGLSWQSRRGPAGAGLTFDPLAAPAAYARAAEGADAILDLAGVTSGDAAALALNRDLALASVAAARAAGVARVFVASSAAVYGRTCGPARETDMLRPLSPYGEAKRDMEEAVLARSGSGSPGVTCLRIANVAGADRLLGAAPGAGVQVLDVSGDGRGPARSYVGPQALAAMLGALFARARSDGAMPPVLNLALDGGVRMEDLLKADCRAWTPRVAPAGLVAEVRLDTGLLAATIGPLARAEAAAIVADYRTLVPAERPARQDAGEARR